jgi:hypothetical protein
LPLTQPYDWNGSPCMNLNLVLEKRHYPPLRAEDREPSPTIARLLSDLAAVAIGRGLEDPVKTTSIWREEFRAHRYAVTVPAERAHEVARQLCVEFDLRSGLGSYEFLGTAARVEQIQQCGHYRFSGFLENCSSLNAPRTAPFALSRQAFLWPILNIETSRLHEAATVVDALGDQVEQCAMVKEYLGWRFGPSETSPRTQGNYLLISQQKREYALFVGFQQHASDDPPVERFITAAMSVLNQLGATFKKVPSPH